jgi:HlyD family secretion protein
MHFKRKVILILLAGAVLLAVIYGFLPEPVPVDTAEVIRSPMRVTIEEEGKTRVIDRFVISSPLTGIANRITYNVGDPVEQGQVLVTIDPLRMNVLDTRSQAEAETRVAAATAALSEAEERRNAARATAELAETELNRIKDLFENGFVSQKKLDVAETEDRRSKAMLRSAEFTVNVARYELETTRASLHYSESGTIRTYEEPVIVRAPVSGRILKIAHESAGAVREGEPLLEIGNPQALEIEVRWGGSSPLAGKVRVIEPAGFTKISALGVEEQRVLIISDITSPYDEWKQLGDGYRVEAYFLLWEGSSVLQIPSSSLFRYEDGWAVFVLERGKAHLKSIRIGHRNSLNAEVRSGLTEGEAVITHPDSSIQDGNRVRLR